MSDPPPPSSPTTISWLPAKSFRHFIAGGSVRVLLNFTAFSNIYFNRLGGMCGAIVTSPFDVVKTRLQSSLFREKHSAVNIISKASGEALVLPKRPGGLLYNFVETGQILRYAFSTGLTIL